MKNIINIIVIIVILLSALTLPACRDGLDDYISITIMNRSDEPIYVARMRTDIIGQNIPGIRYPSILTNIGAKQMHEFDMIDTRIFKDDGVLEVFIIKKSTMDNFIEDKSEMQLPLDKYLYYTYGELEAMNFKIIYTGE